MAENIIPRLMPEWLNSNQHRSYPLDESTNGNGLPTSFLVDALFINSVNIDSSRLYIKSIIKSGDNINISMAGYYTTDIENIWDLSSYTPVDFGVVAIVPFNVSSGTRVPISKTYDGCTLAGSIIIGNTDCLNKAPNVLEFTEETGKLFDGCVRSTDDALLGIEVNNKIYSGIVTLSAGDGIEFIVEEDAGAGSVEIKIVNKNSYEIPDENMVITDDELLLQALESTGAPVKTICGVHPDADGNITFATPKSGEGEQECVSAAGAGDGAVLLTIANDTTDTRCTDNSAQIESLLQTLSALNERASDMQETLTGLEEAVSNLSLQVSRS